MFKPHPAPKRVHLCDGVDCRCPVTIQWVSHIHNTPYEVQDDHFNCGPVAIINAFHFRNLSPGRSLRRLIVTGCNPKPRHYDGFKGTKPENIGIVLNRVFGDKVRHFVGTRDCTSALHSESFKEFIVLYSFMKNKAQYWHYIFTYKVFDIKENQYIYYTQNDGTLIELKFSLSQFMDERMALEGSTPIQYPQMWAISP